VAFSSKILLVSETLGT